MKRSEMVTKLRHIILDHMNCYSECCSTDDEMYSRILLEIEKVGMVPPPYLGLIATAKKYNSVTDFAKDTFLLNKWEPENDEK